MGVDAILSRLSGVRATGTDRWHARCPAHADKSPSLTIRALPDGRVLIHCFALCEPMDVMGAIGLTLSDLFPAPLDQNMPKFGVGFSAFDALKCLMAEAAIVALAASDISLGRRLTDTDVERVATAAGRIASAMEVTHAR